MGHRRRHSERLSYIRNFAVTTMGQHKIKPESYHELSSIEKIVEQLRAKHFSAVFNSVSILTDETLGRLAACGRPDDAERQKIGMGTSLHDINCRSDKWINGRYGGLNMLQSIAVSAILAEVCNQIIKDHPLKHQLKNPF